MGQDYGLLDLVGIIGALTICAAYLLVSIRRVDPEGVRYQGANALGSTLLLISLAFRPNPGAILIEAIWLAIAVFALTRIWLRRG
ncbi:MAG TPA: hypothetical protein VMM59_02780 [Thermohalobaculum sp.]|nr:hypothetical protein [Thermohalobaculum sp.]